MCLLIETIKISERQFCNLAAHNARMNAARKELLGFSNSLDIAESVAIPVELGNGIYKCTVTYGETIVKSEFNSYSVRKIRSLKAVYSNTIEYNYKYADRAILNSLLKQRGACNEIIVIKNGLLTDTSFSNIIFYDRNKWITPKIPLLKGTKREQLLREGFLTEENIRLNDLMNFSKACLINSMLEPGDISIDCRNIYA